MTERCDYRDLTLPNLSSSYVDSEIKIQDSKEICTLIMKHFPLIIFIILFFYNKSTSCYRYYLIVISVIVKDLYFVLGHYRGYINYRCKCAVW